MSLRVQILSLMLTLSFSAFSHTSLDYPRGGENFEPGQTINIKWREIQMHEDTNWDLYFSEDGGITWEVIQENMIASQLSIPWKVPNAFISSAQLRIVQDNQDVDYEDISQFTIGMDNPTGPVLSSNLTESPYSIFQSKTGQLILESKKSTELGYSLYSLEGKIIHKGNLLHQNRIQHMNTRPGLYVLWIQVDPIISRKKILIW